MRSNPILKKLGLADNDRAVIIHADDVGMSHASLAAYADLLDGDLLSSASALVPCAWFPATAAFCRDNAAKVDMGVHVTLTSDVAGCRWSALSTRDPASGLLDDLGYLPQTPEAVRDNADPAAVHAEIQAQIEHALAAGIDVTHIDTHQFTIAERPEFFESYVQIALEHGIPPLLIRGHAVDLYDLDHGSAGDEAAGEIAEYMQMLEAQGLPVLDNLYLTPLRTPEGRVEQIGRLLDNMLPGLTLLIIHPAQDTPELRALTRDWQARVADYTAFSSDAMRTLFRKAGVQIIGWKVLRDMLRNALQQG
ncbi:MAG TPA: polysaccharide deacetylase family protein [Anaerolineae bacterium]|nr:polysaccharide deacetylase family protein [Anaerolineae bacterium]HQI86557.1 polysaccharide deacetylase family protein [Anaerolineae bacterium]